jgi:hypothetical protein
LHLDEDGLRKISQGKKETQDVSKNVGPCRDGVRAADDHGRVCTDRRRRRQSGHDGTRQSERTSGRRRSTNTTGGGMTSPNPTVPNANINPGTGQKYDPSNLNDMNNPNNPATRR